MINQAMVFVFQRGFYATATVMPTHDDVLYFQYFYRKLDHRQTIKVRVHHHIGYITMHEDFAGREVDDLISRNAAVGATDP